jgi:putative transposase
MRKPRIVEPGQPHHLILRGNNRRTLFSFPPDYRRFISHLIGATMAHEIELHHFCLMQNHVHLIATPRQPDALARWVRDVAQPYAQYRNRKKQGTGKLFEQRFRSFVIDDIGYLIACTAYVELNPVKAGLVRRAEEYRWSTARLLVGDHAGSCISARAWTPTAFYLALGETPGRRAAEFGAWLGALGRLPAFPAEHERALATTHALLDRYRLRLRRPDGSSCV